MELVKITSGSAVRDPAATKACFVKRYYFNMDDFLDDFSDQMPFTVHVDWFPRHELVIVPYWDDEKLDTFFTVFQDKTELGVMRHSDTTEDHWEWVSGELNKEKAELIGREINRHYFGY